MVMMPLTDDVASSVNKADVGDAQGVAGHGDGTTAIQCRPYL